MSCSRDFYSGTAPLALGVGGLPVKDPGGNEESIVVIGMDDDIASEVVAFPQDPPGLPPSVVTYTRPRTRSKASPMSFRGISPAA